VSDAPPDLPPTPRWLMALWLGAPALLALAIGVAGQGADGGAWLPLGLASALALAARDRAPAAAWALSLLPAVVAALAFAPAIAPALVVAVLPLAALAAGAPPRRSLPAAAVTLVVLGLAARPMATPDAGRGDEVVLALLCLTLTATGWLIGYALRVRRRHAAALEERARWLEDRRVADAAVAAQRERHAIARELHDLVTHNVSVMTVQASAAAAMLDVDGPQARQAVAAVEATGRSAMSELRAMLAALRDDASAERQAQPGLTQLDGLVAPLRHAGLAVDVTVVGDVTDLPAPVGLSAYRIVQEALTNALRHAAASRVTVRVARAAEVLTVEVHDDGVGLAGPPDRSGNGLAGMRERAALLRGTLDVDSSPAGGTTVRARLGLA
jgi:signal transduction histidine kinase